MNNRIIYSIGQAFTKNMIERVNGEQPIDDSYHLLEDLDEDKKYHFYGVELSDIEQYYSTSKMEISASERLYAVRVHEDCTLLSSLSEYGTIFFTNPNENVIMHPGDDVVIASLLDINESLNYNLLVIDRETPGDKYNEKMKRVPLASILKAALENTERKENKDYAFCHNLLTFDDYRIDNEYDRNGDTIRVFVDYLHVPAEKSETGYADFLVVFYKYKTRLE